MTRNPNRETTFMFKRFSVANNASAMKIGTDGVLLGAWASSTSDISRILDIGTGTGLIALMLAQRFQEATVTAVEIDPAAADEATANVARSPWPDRITVVNADFNQWAGDARYDLIVSNPPFFATGMRAPDSQRATARHNDTLTFSDIFKRASAMLCDGGHLCMITPADISDQLIFEATLNRLQIARKCDIVTVEGKPPARCLWDFTASAVRTEETTLTVRTAAGYSDRYRSLTADFYIHL